MAHSTGVVGSGLGLDVLRDQVAIGVQFDGLFNSLAEIVVTVCT